MAISDEPGFAAIVAAECSPDGDCVYPGCVPFNSACQRRGEFVAAGMAAERRRCAALARSRELLRPTATLGRYIGDLIAEAIERGDAAADPGRRGVREDG